MKEIIISNYNGEPVASSLEVAENFGKRHDHVVRDIEKLIALEKEVSPKLGTPPLFFEAVYQHPQNKQYYKCCEMTRDGFMLLAMGFSGQKAPTSAGAFFIFCLKILILSFFLFYIVFQNNCY
jgi:Rha family phage regulatory protein